MSVGPSRRRGVPRRISAAPVRWPASVAAEVDRACSSRPMVLIKDRNRLIRPRTVHNIVFTMSLFQCIVESHAPHLAGCVLSQQVTEDTLSAFREHLLRGVGPRRVHGRIATGNKPRSVLDHLERLLVVAGRVRPAFDLSLIRKEMALVDLPRKRKVVPELTTAMIWDTGQSLMHQAEDRLDRISREYVSPGYQERTGEIFRDGLLLAVMALCALRVGNVTQMRVDHHLLPAEPSYRLYFQSHETKHKRVITGLLPVSLAGRVDVYLRSFRPLIRGAANHDHLWASRNGEGLKYIGVYRIFRATFERLGVRASPHDARRAGVNAIIAGGGTPGGLAQALLGHSAWSTTETYLTERRHRAEKILSSVTGC